MITGELPGVLLTTPALLFLRSAGFFNTLRIPCKAYKLRFEHHVV